MEDSSSRAVGLNVFHPKSFLQRSEQCVVHLGHWIPHPPPFLNSQVWGQQYWEAEGEHRREVPYLSFSPSPSPPSSSRSLICLTIHLSPLPCVWSRVHSSSQMRCGFWYLGKQTLYNLLSLLSDSITVVLGVTEVGFHLFGGYGCWLRSEGFRGILVLTSDNYGWHSWSTSLCQALC